MFDRAGVRYSKVSIVEIGTSWARRQELSCFPTVGSDKLVDVSFFDLEDCIGSYLS